MKRYTALLLFLVVAISSAIAQDNNIVPAFEQVIALQRPSNPMLSPDGKHTLFTVSSTDWENNRFDTEIWLSKNDELPFQLTRTKDGSSFSPAWSPDGKYITFKAKRGESTQIHAISVMGGEAFPITAEKGSIGSYEWSPDSKQIAFTMQPDQEKAQKVRREKYGAFEEDDAEYELSWLYIIDFAPDFAIKLPCYDKKDSTAQAWTCQEMPKATAIIDSVDYTIRNFQWSPDGKQIAFTHTPDPLINSFFDADISLVHLEDKSVVSLVNNPSADFLEDWSPDGTSILYSSSLDNRSSNYYKNGKYFILNLNNKQPKQIATTFDENLSRLTWTTKGIFATAWQRTTRPILQINPETDVMRIYRSKPTSIYGFSFDKNASQIALYGENGDDLSEIYRSDFEDTKMTQLTNYSQQIENWQTAKSEIINWKSKDGALIEGILHKPANYDPNQKYPLLVMIHGGPTGIDRPTPVPGYVYPALQWLAKGALILRPNYRGSAGYGEKFRALNVENLGVGDAWDVHSGIDYLVSQDLIDTTKMGAMGWSQGGYISAFLTTTSDRFKAISVGAGISNWMTYYVNTDIHPFTRQYLKATPWSNEEVYRKTSPMTYINQATTPTLIQHGEFDRRVPPANAYELLQG
ncbi:MAG: S9 family peptidase, partial [Bacteroidota bacterium]